ncbi:polysaccharide deacetylase [Streptomyces lividans]|nr:polysaccharide deacetylase [Streptomyces lividans TK24]PSK50296.1 Gellan lyase [Streptomyces sp. 111WW2]QSJ11322.1 polysaccharide deacetylase [Streptomyces lividans]REH21087.1 peptidoglycan/xylan/chitin deacetylase (PgdA/CDA1 family) [Streptomyces sp. 2221.1]SDT44144.1 Peptidoglycan/xylan/chitin deacetylase, PgdA/CDA1 family [Streptomyces sp. 2114.2]BDD72270.1 polysaccharide deacetylase [Streptomyces coelicolor]GHB97497.1 polysaccharide deacetylase [Streptomyces anthocyanicus]
MAVSASGSPSTTTTADARPGPGPAPVPWIAMYHSVGDRSDDPYRITVTPDRLDAQLGWLRRRGLRGVPVGELLAARARGGGGDLVGLTFDDGYADFVEHALPCLRRHGCGATLFVLPGRLGGVNSWDPLGPRKPLLTADGIRRAAAEGVEIGSHGLTHVDLTTADDTTLTAETAESRALLSELAGAPVTGFCYPYGTVDARAADAVRAAGYTYACAIDPGPLTGPYALPRVHVGQNDTPVRLLLKTRLHRLRRRAAAGV